MTIKGLLLVNFIFICSGFMYGHLTQNWELAEERVWTSIQASFLCFCFNGPETTKKSLL